MPYRSITSMKASLYWIFAGFAVLALALIGPLWPRQQAAAAPALAQISIPATSEGQYLQLKAWMATPSGDGPFPFVIIVHGCNGLWGTSGDWANAQQWAGWLNQQGFGAVILDSFSPRGLGNICGESKMELPAPVRAGDLFAVASYLSKVPSVRPDAIGAVGFSHGGSTVLFAAADGSSNTGAAKRGRIAAVVAVYPGCKGLTQSTFSIPALLLLGGADDWTSPAVCQQLYSYNSGSRGPVMLKLYPGATHAFDVPKPNRTTALGFHLRYDAAATADAKVQIKNFFARYLGSNNSNL
jgi:dienelactone hydrolase